MIKGRGNLHRKKKILGLVRAKTQKNGMKKHSTATGQKRDEKRNMNGRDTQRLAVKVTLMTRDHTNGKNIKELKTKRKGRKERRKKEERVMSRNGLRKNVEKL